MKKNYKVNVAASFFVSMTAIPEATLANDEGSTLGNDGFSAFEEIVVTARKREETLQDIPVAVSAISGQDLEVKGLENAEDLFSLAPGLYYSQAGQRKNDEQFYLTIRGVGSSPVVEPSVGVFVDGIYMPSLGWSSEFLDVARVEVLRGPQGSLFGRNTLAGALNIVSKAPSDEFTGKVNVEISEFDAYKTAISLSGGLTDYIGASLSIFGTKTDGFVKNVVRNEEQDDRETYGGRAKLAFNISEASDFTVFVDYRKSEGRFNALGDASKGIRYRIDDPNTGIGVGSYTENHALAGKKYTTFSEDEQTTEVESYGAGATFDYDFRDFTLTSITGYRYVESIDQYDVDGVDALAINNATTEQEILSQEIRLASNDSERISYIGGLYLFSEELIQNRTLNTAPNTTVGGSNLLINAVGPGFPAIVRDDVNIERKGVALFGQLGFAITDQLNATFGLRYSYEEVDQAPDLFVDVLGGAVSADNELERSDDYAGISPSFSLNYDFNSSTMAYMSVATGFKGGGFTKEVPNTPEQNQSLDNEESTSYELGLKSRFLDDTVQMNAALFLTEIEEMQLATRVDIGGGIFIPSTANAGEAETRGLELEVLARPTEALELSLSLSYVDSEFKEYDQVPVGGGAMLYSRAGQRLPEVPELSGSFSASYNFRVKDVEITPSVTYRYIGDKFIGDGTDAVPFLEMDSYGVVDAQITAYLERFTLIAFVNNLSDKYYITNQEQNQAILSVAGKRSYSVPGAPREFGLRAIYEF
ncbi:TonB-dependent receptor [Pseudomaricurvus alkylphenolicus]|uniref:TonB-dependent receptor n=1 Tax=Pseudomaricurvus alkylphenolicus TaxID=1306991 RepID=UPI001421B1B1|nr:TonB-dependent receptor [Pseudomaricurvus alkylphenolicus]NIB44449.1 TonB-dependent receptor [Pseudomaricurvus alkylphenolicus]